jgi:hypothetical protein
VGIFKIEPNLRQSCSVLLLIWATQKIVDDANPITPRVPIKDEYVPALHAWQVPELLATGETQGLQITSLFPLNSNVSY